MNACAAPRTRTQRAPAWLGGRGRRPANSCPTLAIGLFLGVCPNRVWSPRASCRVRLSIMAFLPVSIMNDHASALGVWLDSNFHGATVLHIDRHSDLASPSRCRPNVMPVHDRAAWRACTDRAGFQLAAAWLGTVDRVWWLKPGSSDNHRDWQHGFVSATSPHDKASLFWSALPPTHGTVQRLATRVSDLHELSRSVADSRGPLLLDVDLDYWGGAAGPSRPAWEIPALSQCAELLRSIGSAAWGDARGQRTTDSLWPALLDSRALPSTTTTTTTNASAMASARAPWRAQERRGERTSAMASAPPPPRRTKLLSRCAVELASQGLSGEQRARLRFAKQLGLSLPEALSALAPHLDDNPHACDPVDEGQLTALLRLLPSPAAVTIARSIDGFVPFRCVELLEAAVLRALRAAFANSTASATPGASSRTLTLNYLPGCASSASLRALRRS
jgi:hypothetical protein